MSRRRRGSSATTLSMPRMTLSVGVHGLVVQEGRLARQELEKEDAQRPPIHSLRVAARGDDFGCEVVRGAASGVGLADGEFGEAHIRELDVALLCEQQILRLQIPVENVTLVQMLEGKDHARGVVLCVLDLAVEVPPVVGRKKFAPERRFQQEVERLSAVVRCVHLDDEGRVRHYQDVLRVHDSLLLPHLDDVALTQALEGVALAGLRVLPELHHPEVATTQQADLPQVLFQDLLRCLLLHTVLHRTAAQAYGGAPFVVDEILQRPQQRVERAAV
mmetsp:Transcript_9221/g.28288  ORF Transcript_9221/g.28288 Transcript_9221/m.28288 type:complete len:275 (-) Transcript_9221:331-1155(-)